MELGLDFKTAVDIGLGGISLMLWLRQGKVNKAQVALDAKQNKATDDLAMLIKDHDERISALEAKRARGRGAGAKCGK